jgi:hypothetical protein
MKKRIEEYCLLLLKVLTQNEKGNGWYKMLGGYWELIYPMLEKYQPERLKLYDKLLADELNYFNIRVYKNLDSGDEYENWQNAVRYMNERIANMNSPQDYHLIDLGNDEIISYIPNQPIDQEIYWGRDSKQENENN